MVRRFAVIAFWRTVALVCCVLGIVGAFVPVLPTTPFLLVAVWAASKGWPQLEAWLIGHPRYGPPIRRWRDHRAVPRSAKWLASATMLASAVSVALSQVPLAVRIGIPVFLAGIALWLWRRPEI
jgi:uncharacterized membrane protein YbaN (DUF454 family)